MRNTYHNIFNWLQVITLSFIICHLSFSPARAQDSLSHIETQESFRSLVAQDLHKGLNVDVGTSIFGSWGSKHYRGTGFNQDVSVTYLTTLSPKTTLAVGGYVDNTLWRGSNYTAAGIRALLNYRINDHWSAYAFVQKAFDSGNIRHTGLYGPYGYYPIMGGYGYGSLSYGGRLSGGYPHMDRIGAGLRYEWGKWNQNSIQIHVEVDRMPNQHDHYYDTSRYDYPVR